MCEQYSEKVIYITEIIDGLERALNTETIYKLYNDYIAQINNYNSHIDSLLKHRKDTSRYYKKPKSLSVFKHTYLRPVIILKLMNSIEAQCFENLSSEDLMYILGNTTPRQLYELERIVQRKLLRPEYRKSFTALRENVIKLQETQEYTTNSSLKLLDNI